MKLLSKSKEIECVKWDCEESTAQVVAESFGLSVVVLKDVVPYQLKVWLPDGTIKFLANNDVVGKDNDGDIVVIPQAVVEVYFEEVPEEVPEEAEKKETIVEKIFGSKSKKK